MHELGDARTLQPWYLALDGGYRYAVLGRTYELSLSEEEGRLDLRSAPSDSSAHHDLGWVHELVFSMLGFHDLCHAPRTLELGLMISSAVKPPVRAQAQGEAEFGHVNS
ncbi:hypothetical protein Dimus_016666 [Dionaea muscipula]